MHRAYAPYSEFHVGAALLTPGGDIVEGCNVENSSYPCGGCAERGALFAAIVAGHRQFTHLTIVTQADEPTPPCGMCRQALVEFAPALEVAVARAIAEPAPDAAMPAHLRPDPHAFSRPLIAPFGVEPCASN